MAVPALSRAEHLATGLTISSIGTPAVNATYHVQAGDQLKIMAVSLYIQVNGVFPAGQSVWPWPDASETPRMFPSVSLFQAFATAMADFVAGIELAILSGAAFPASSVTIP